jgi:hypothetical protein
MKSDNECLDFVSTSLIVFYLECKNKGYLREIKIKPKKSSRAEYNSMIVCVYTLAKPLATVPRCEQVFDSAQFLRDQSWRLVAEPLAAFPGCEQEEKYNCLLNTMKRSRFRETLTFHSCLLIL